MKPTTPRLFVLGATIVILATRAASASPPAPSKAECIAASESAQDLRHAGKLLEARAQFTVCVADSCPDAVRQDCAVQSKEVQAAIPSILFNAKDRAGNDLAAVSVTLDGQPLLDKLAGAAIEVDPGAHQFAFEYLTAGLRVERALVVREGDKSRRVPIVFDTSAGTDREVEAPGSVVPTAPPSPASSSLGSVQRTWGLTLGGAGVASLVIGSLLGLVASGTYNSIPGACRGGTGPCSASDANTSGIAHSQAAASTVGFVAGAALLAGGAAFYFSAPRGGALSVAPAVGIGGAGLQMEVTW